MTTAMTHTIPLPEGLKAHFKENTLSITGPTGTTQRIFSNPLIKIEHHNSTFILTIKGDKRKQKRLLNTIKAHVNNMIRGAQHTYLYKLKVCSGHFPITVKKEGDTVAISNFLGEKIPRIAPILPGVAVNIDKDIITVTSPDKEAAGQTAANLERATRITNRDRRVFQDGCYIIEKPERSLS